MISGRFGFGYLGEIVCEVVRMLNIFFLVWFFCYYLFFLGFFLEVEGKGRCSFCVVVFVGIRF